MEKLMKLIMLIACAAWCAWIAVGGNHGDMEVTINGTLTAACVCGIAFIGMMIRRWKHG